MSQSLWVTKQIQSYFFPLPFCKTLRIMCIFIYMSKFNFTLFKAWTSSTLFSKLNFSLLKVWTSCKLLFESYYNVVGGFILNFVVTFYIHLGNLMEFYVIFFYYIKQIVLRKQYSKIWYVNILMSGGNCK